MASWELLLMNSLKLVIPSRFISWKETPNDVVTPQRQSHFTPKMKANAVPCLLSSLMWIDQYNKCNGMTGFMESMIISLKGPQRSPKSPQGQIRGKGIQVLICLPSVHCISVRSLLWAYQPLLHHLHIVSCRSEVTAHKRIPTTVAQISNTVQNRR